MKVDNQVVNVKIKDEKLKKLYDYFNQFKGSEEFYVGDIKETIVNLDNNKYNFV